MVWECEGNRTKCTKCEGLQVCVGSGGPRAWSCVGAAEQPCRRGHFADACFNIRFGLPRLLHAIAPFRELPRCCTRHVTAESCPVNRGGQSDTTNRYLMYCDDYQHWSPWAWGWVR